MISSNIDRSMKNDMGPLPCHLRGSAPIIQVRTKRPKVKENQYIELTRPELERDPPRALVRKVTCIVRGGSSPSKGGYSPSNCQVSLSYKST